MKTAVVALGKIGLPAGGARSRPAARTSSGVDINPTVIDLVNTGIEPFPGEAESGQPPCRRSSRWGS